MLEKKQINEIREILERCSNPLFFFDNDQDGLCSYLLLRRKYGKGNGIPVKNFPMGKEYFRRVIEFNPDIIFVLDQPLVDKDFFEAVRELNLPIIWIDHHENDLNKIPNFVRYFNPLYNKNKNNFPVTYLCNQIVEDENEFWISVSGCVADKFFPDFYDKFFKSFPDLGINSEEPFKILYNSQIGRISRMMGAGLKDRTTNVMKMIRYLIEVKSPYNLLEKTKENSSFYERFEVINSKFEKLFSKAKKTNIEKNVLFFVYEGETSMSADLSNKLSFSFPDKLVCVCYIKGLKVNASLRGRNIKPKILEILEKIPFSRGGGHDDAVGLQIDKDNLNFFKEELLKLDYKNI
jgi:single-stranded DNA-specific DHH superfamily exonuclease